MRDCAGLETGKLAHSDAISLLAMHIRAIKLKLNVGVDTYNECITSI